MTLTVIMLLWTIAGLLSAIVIRITPRLVKEYPMQSILLCLWLGPSWWILYCIMWHRYLKGDRT